MSELAAVDTQEIIARIKSESKPENHWIFDCDGTLITGDIASHTAWWLIRSGLAHPEHLPGEWKMFKDAPFDYETFHLLRKIIIEKRGLNGVYEWEVLLHSGLPQSTIKKLVGEVVEQGISQKSLVFTHPLSDLCEEMKKQVWIVSGSPHDCVSTLVSRLGIADDRVLGTLLDQVDGIYTKTISSPGIVWEQLKQTVLEGQGIHNPWFVAGDSIGDWYMFNMATHWCWCVVWDEHRHRGEEFREIVQERLLNSGGFTLPKTPGTYFHRVQNKNWVFEVKRP